jgi:hypothetical protein
VRKKNKQYKKRRRGEQRFKKSKVHLLLVVFLAIFSFSLIKIIPKIFAETTASVTKGTDTDFGQGSLSSAEVSGSGSSAYVKLSGGGGVSWWDHDYTYRRRLTIDNSSGSTVHEGYSVKIEFDDGTTPTAQDLYDESTAGTKGDDFRIVHVGGSDEELDRHVVNFSGSNIEIWFSLQNDIAAGGSSSDYYLYYKNSGAENPPANLGNIYRMDCAGSKTQVTFGSGNTNHGIATDGDYVYMTSGSQLTKVAMDGTVIETKNVSLGGDSKGIAYSHGRIFGRQGANSITAYDWSSGTTTSINIPGDKPLLSGSSWDTSNLGSDPQGRILTLQYVSGQSLILRRYTVSGDSLVWADDVSLSGSFQNVDNHGISSDGHHLMLISYNDGWRRWNLDDGSDEVSFSSAGNTQLHPSGMSNPTFTAYNWKTGETLIGDYDSREFWKYSAGRMSVSPEPTVSAGEEGGALSPSGTWTSPTDSNAIDLIWNGGWGDGSDDSTAFSATVANVGANSSVTFQMRTASSKANLSSATYETIGIANSGTTLTKTKADLDALGLPTGSAGRYAQVKATLTSSNGVDNPHLDSFTINYLKDNTRPGTNASSVLMKKQAGGDNVTLDSWVNGNSPYFSWSEGDDTQSGVKGYCLYLGKDPTGNPENDKGRLGNSPVSTVGTTCQFLTDQTYIDFATSSLRGSPWLTSDSGEYYFNVKAVDNAGNVYGGDSAQFSFYFDNTSPTNPSGLSAPQGYQSSIDGITIYWSTSGATAAVDSHSHVKGYQYKIGSDGTWLGDSRTGLEDCNDLLTAGNYTLSSVYDTLTEGENTFYLRTWDNACNVSSEAVTGILKYSGNAPSEPRNLSVDPSTNTENSFAFSWEVPQTFMGQSSGLTYCYSVNSVPSVSSCSWTGSTTLAADTFATQPGTNTFYVLAKDEAGNFNYGAYSSVNFDANTSAPGIPRNTDVADISIKATSNWKLAISWEEPSDKGVGVDAYKIYRSSSATSCSSDFPSFKEIGTTGGTSYADTSLSQQDYYYCVKACDSANNCSAVSSTATGYPDGKFTDAPALTSGPTASLITTKRATVSWATDRDSDSKVAYGTSSGKYNSEEPSNSTQTTSHEINLTNLSPGTTYRYRARWTDEDGNIGQSTERSFTTDPAPEIIDPKVTSVGISSATLQYTVKGATKVNILYGVTTSFGGVTEVMTSTSETTYTTTLEGLIDGTKYYYKINTFDSEGDEYQGNTLTFDTLPRPRITNVRIQQARNTAQPTILVSWESNTEVSSIVTYFPEGKPEEARDEVNIDPISGEHKMVIEGVLPETNYMLVVKGRDKAGNEASSDNQKVTTATDTRPPLISSLSVEGSNVASTGTNSAQQASSQLVVTWDTDEVATSQVEFGEGTGSNYSQKTQEDSNLTFNHLVVISGLTPSKVYHLRAVSADKAGNISDSVDTVTVTPKAADNALDLVVGNLREMFGFLGGIGN